MAKSLKSEIKGSELHVRFEGDIDVSEELILQHHPHVKSLLKEITGHEWKYSFENVKGEAIVRVDLNKAVFDYRYYPPRFDEFEKKGVYELQIPLGSKRPAIVDIRKMEHFRIRISTKRYWHAATIDPFTNKVTYIENPFRFGFLAEEQPNKFAQARELYELSKWLFQEKKMEAEDRYVVENYNALLEAFERKRYTFPLRLRITVEDEKKVPTWEELLDGLSQYLKAKGLLMKLEEKPGFFEKRPLP